MFRLNPPSRWVYSSAFGAVALTAAAVPAAGQECYDCEERTPNPWTIEHRMLELPRPLAFWYWGNFHWDWVEGNCESHHFECGTLSAIDIDALLDDPASLQQAVEDSDQLLIDTARNVLVVLDCHGDVLDELPIGVEVMEQIAGPAEGGV